MFVHTEIATLETFAAIPASMSTILTLTLPSNTPSIDALSALTPTFSVANTSLVVTSGTFTTIA